MEDKPVALRRLLRHTRSERAVVAMSWRCLRWSACRPFCSARTAPSRYLHQEAPGFDAVIDQGLSNALDDWRSISPWLQKPRVAV